MNDAVKSPANRRRLILLALGGVFGAVGGIGVGRLLKAQDIQLEGLSWSDGLALVIALCLIVSALIVGFATLNRRAATQVMDRTSDRPATAAQLGYYRQQAITSLLAGLMLATPVVVTALFQPLPVPVAMIIMTVIGAAFLVQTVSNLMVWRQADELVRSMIGETAAICFWVLQGPLFLWAAAEKLDLAPALTAWDLITLLMGFYLLVSALISLRRGLI